MYSVQRPKLVVEPSVDQVVFFYIFSIIVDRIKSFMALELNFLKVSIKQYYYKGVKCI